MSQELQDSLNLDPREPFISEGLDEAEVYDIRGRDDSQPGIIDETELPF